MNKIINLLFFVFLFSFSIEAQFSQPFITVWKTDNSGQSESNQVQLPISTTSVLSDYNFNVFWQDVNNPSISGTYNFDPSEASPGKITFPSPGEYRLEISGTFPIISFSYMPNEVADKLKLIRIEQWGSNSWKSLEGAFNGCQNLTYTALDAPDLTSLENTSFAYLFANCHNFNGEIGNWDVSNVTDMKGMFYNNSLFNQDIGNWNVHNVTDMGEMFYYAVVFNKSLNNWDVSNVTNMSYMFSNAGLYNQDMMRWNVSNVINMSGMFNNAFAFNQNLDSWDVSKVTTMRSMFMCNSHSISNFNGRIGNWNVSSVTDMSNMFWNAGMFNEYIDTWYVRNVTNMENMFSGASSFNQELTHWNTINVTSMKNMFTSCIRFNQDISSWDVRNVKYMDGMFADARMFNQNIGEWDVANVIDMTSMFSGADMFDQDLGNWKVNNVVNMYQMFYNVKLSTCNYNSILNGWSKLPLQKNVHLNAGRSNYSKELEALRESLIYGFGWTIEDGGKLLGASDFNIDNSITVTGNVLTANASNLSYQWIDCNNNYSPITGEIMQSFTAQNPGNYAVEVSSALGCMNISSCYEIKTASTFEDEALTDITIYPNPAQNELFIKFKMQNQSDNDIEITDLKGLKLIEHKKFLSNNSINIESLAAGVYLVKIKEKQSEYVIKFTKE